MPRASTPPTDGFYFSKLNLKRLEDLLIASVRARLRKACSKATREAVFTIFWPARRADVFDYFYKRLGNRQAAEDATQDTGQALWEELPRYDPHKGPLIAFVFTLAWGVL